MGTLDKLYLHTICIYNEHKVSVRRLTRLHQQPPQALSFIGAHEQAKENIYMHLR